jgi:hypothetical protein
VKSRGNPWTLYQRPQIAADYRGLPQIAGNKNLPIRKALSNRRFAIRGLFTRDRRLPRITADCHRLPVTKTFPSVKSRGNPWTLYQGPQITRITADCHGLPVTNTFPFVKSRGNPWTLYQRPQIAADYRGLPQIAGNKNLPIREKPW